MTLNKLIIYPLLCASLHINLSAQNGEQDTIVASETFIEAGDSLAADESKSSPAVNIPLIYKDRKFTKGFKDKYTDSDFTYETKTKVKSQWERFLEWLGKLIDDIFSVGDKTTGTSAFTIFMRIMAGLIIGFAIYMIVRALLNKEGMWIFGRSRKNISVQDINEENIHQMDFNQLTEKTKKDGDYKLAVRYYYLWLLKKLSANEIIDWHWDKTNSDYLYEIKNSTLKKDFEYLSYLYDYSWYGDFPLDEAAFLKAEKAFKKTLNTL